MSVSKYHKTDNAQLSANFRVSEFSCHGRGCCDSVLIDDTLVAFLQQIRNHFEKPVTVNSGYRCPNHNKQVGGATGSYHTKGMAADIAVQGVAPAEVARYAESMGVPGIGLYETPSDGFFVHIDTRPVRSFWYGQNCAYRASFGGYGFSRFTAELEQALGVSRDNLIVHAPTLGQFWNRTHPAVKPVQKYLRALGYEAVGDADGIAGVKFAAAVAHFQADHGCENTGILEQWGRSWHILLQTGKEKEL